MWENILLYGNENKVNITVSMWYVPLRVCKAVTSEDSTPSCSKKV